MERTSFRKAWRSPRILRGCAPFIFDHVSRKGYDRLITHAKPAYARLWRMVLGFKDVPEKGPLLFEGHGEPYVELVKDLTPPANAISSQTDVATLFRVEGFWDERSEFEAAEL